MEVSNLMVEQQAEDQNDEDMSKFVGAKRKRKDICGGGGGVT